MLISEQTIFYIAQEAAMAPGVVKHWPAYIPHPTDKNGRLRQITYRELREAMQGERVADALRTQANAWHETMHGDQYGEDFTECGEKECLAVQVALGIETL